MRVEEVAVEYVTTLGELGRFIEQFSVFAGGPGGVGRLRELVLELAVRGQLVKQHNIDEPGFVLLDKINVEKEQLSKAKRIKKPKVLPEINNEEKPHRIPENWEWVRLEGLYYSISPSGKKLKSSEIDQAGEYPVVDQGEKYISGYTNSSELVINIPGPVVVFGDHTTEIKYVDFNFVAGADGTKILRPYCMNERYFYLYLRQYKLENRGYSRHFKVLNNNLMALPPLKEQKRIVAKVDELMALCDQLEAQQQQQTNTVLRANTSAINVLLNSDSQSTIASESNSFENNWQRIAKHFNTLYGCTLPMPPGEGRQKRYLVGLENLKGLHNCILELAIEGFLSKRGSFQILSLGDLLVEKSLNGISKKPNQSGPGTEILRISAGTSRKDSITNELDHRFVLIDKNEQLKFLLQKGDLLACRFNGNLSYVGRLSLYTGFSNCSQVFPDKLIRLRVDRKICIPEYVRYAFIAPKTRLTIEAMCATTAGNIGLSATNLKKIEICIPSLEEQTRIVKKVDQLMTLCDKLEQQLTQSYSDAEKLLEATVKALVA